MSVNVWNHSISLELFKVKHHHVIILVVFFLESFIDHHLIILVVFFLESFIDLVEIDIENYYGPKIHAV